MVDSIAKGLPEENDIAVLDRRLKESGRNLAAFDLFFEAMAYKLLGDQTRALAVEQGAKEWFHAHQHELTAGYRSELDRFKAEAAVLDPGPEFLPDDVFVPIIRKR